MKKRVAVFLFLFLICSILTGCIESSSSVSLNPSGSTAGGADSSVGETAENEKEELFKIPESHAGISVEIDFGDPTERTEISGGIYDLNPAIPRTLEERRQALLTQIDLSRCGSIRLTGLTLQEAIQLTDGVLPEGSTEESEFYQADDGRLFFFETYSDMLSCLYGCPLSSYGITYVLAINRSYSPYFQLFYDGELPASGNLSDVPITAIYFLGKLDTNEEEIKKELQDWVHSAPEEAQKLLSYDEAMVYLIRQMGWTDFTRKIDSKGRPYYTNGDVMIIGTDLSLDRSPDGIYRPVLRFELTLYWVEDGEKVLQGNDLFPISVYSDGTMGDSFEEIVTYLESNRESMLRFYEIASSQKSDSQQG